MIVSSSPQVRYPDYYGIDMAKMSEFIAFKAAIELLKERDMKDVIAAASPEIERSGRIAERTNGELREGYLCAVHR